jgi:hypothetical protein
MRYLLLPLLLLAGCAGRYEPGYDYGYGYGYGPGPAYAYSDYDRGYDAPATYSDRGPYGAENCGTPERWRACPGRWRYR